jgi:hypothetical protein
VEQSEYWSLDIPGLTEEGAERLRQVALGEAEWGATVSDPGSVMVRGFDRATVELLRKCLVAGLASGGLSHEDRSGAQSMIEDCDGWLEQAR